MNPLNAPLQAVPPTLVYDFSLTLLVSYHMKSHNNFYEIHGLISGKLISITRHIDVWSYLTTFLLTEGTLFWAGKREEQAMLRMQLTFNTASFPIALIKIISYGMLMQHDCIIASCTALTYLLSHTKLDNVKTFQPGGNVIMLLNAVQRDGTSVLLRPRMLGQRHDWCEHLASTSLSLSSCQEGLLAFQLCLCSGRLVGARFSILGSGWPHLQPSGSALRGGGGRMVKGVWGSAGLLGARGGKRRGLGFGNPEWLVENHKLLQNSLAISSRALGDVEEAVTAVSLWWACELISPSAARKVMLFSCWGQLTQTSTTLQSFLTRML